MVDPAIGEISMQGGVRWWISGNDVITDYAPLNDDTFKAFRLALLQVGLSLKSEERGVGVDHRRGLNFQLTTLNSIHKLPREAARPVFAHARPRCKDRGHSRIPPRFGNFNNGCPEFGFAEMAMTRLRIGFCRCRNVQEVRDMIHRVVECMRSFDQAQSSINCRHPRPHHCSVPATEYCARAPTSDAAEDG